MRFSIYPRLGPALSPEGSLGFFATTVDILEVGSDDSPSGAQSPGLAAVNNAEIKHTKDR